MSLKLFTKHLESVGLRQEAEVINSLLTTGKVRKLRQKFLSARVSRIRKANDLEWQINIIRTPERTLTRRDVYNYYMEIADRLLKEIGNGQLAVVRKDSTDFVDVADFGDSLKDRRNALSKLFADKLLTLYSVFGTDIKDFWIKVNPGKDYDFVKVKKVVPNIVDLVRSIPNTKKVKVYFTGDNGFYVVGNLKDSQNLNILRELISEKLEEYVEDKANIVLGTPSEEQLGLDISNFKNTGSAPVPYSLNEKTGLVVIPVENIDLFRKENAEIRRVLGHKPRNIELISSRSLSTRYAVDEMENKSFKKAFRKLSSYIRQLSQKFDPSKVSTTSANIGSIKIDTKLDTQKIKNALKHLQDKDYAAFAKARDFDYIISDVTAKDSGMNVPSGKAAWFNSSIPDVCFIVKSYADSADEEQLASTILHEAQHGRYPGYGEWTAEHAEEKLNTAKLLRSAFLVSAAQGYDPRGYARSLQKGFEDQAKAIIEDAKKVKDRASWSKFRSKYKEADVMRAYAFQVAIATLSKIFSTVDPELRLDIFNKVLYDPERRYGITKALVSYDPTKEGGKSLNGYINDHINHGIINVLKEEFKSKPGEERLSDKLDEGGESTTTKEQLLHEVGDFNIVTRDLKQTIHRIREIISTQWKDDPSYGEPENAVNLFNYFISDIVSNPAVSEVFEDEPYLTRQQIIEGLGMEIPSMFCLDCGQKFVFERDWENKILKYEKTGCPQTAAAEHQIGWTDGVYNTEKAITDPSYKYRIGYERALGSGSKSDNAPVVASLRGLSKVALYEEEEEDISVTPQLQQEKVEKSESVVDEADRENHYIKSLPTDSYEYRRIKGFNLEKHTPIEDSNVVDSVDSFNTVMDNFVSKLATSLTTAPYYEQFKELVTELSSLVEERTYKIR